MYETLTDDSAIGDTGGENRAEMMREGEDRIWLVRNLQIRTVSRRNVGLV